MATKEFPLVPETIPHVETTYRRITTPIPVPESIEILKHMREAEPRSMGGQPPILWDHGQGVSVSDRYGNTWLDFTSGVLVTASGHGRKEQVDAITAIAQQGLYHAYCFPTEIRGRLVDRIRGLLPKPLSHVFLLTTGSEATECCLKLARTWGQSKGGNRKSIFVTFSHAFHGRTMGSQWAGGIPGLKTWMGDADPRFVNVPYPDGFRQKDTAFDVFERGLAEQGINPEDVCGVMSETFQGCNATLMPVEYAQALRKWCTAHDALLIFDEVQAAFGRTGKTFAFQHYGITPELVACGKGISGGMPLSAVVGVDAVMNQYGPGEMTSTHSANPICCAAALANLDAIVNENLIENAAKLDPVLREEAASVAKAAKGHIGRHDSVGLVAALQFTHSGTTDPDPERAWEVVRRACQRGLLIFAPVGVGGCCVKVCPPLIITEDALREGMGVLRDIVAEIA